jgi:Domain of unknown function (DUF4129)
MSLPFDGPPLDPTSPEARQWVRDELARGYQTEPTPWERFVEWLRGLFSGEAISSALPAWVVPLVVVLVVAVLALVVLRLVRPEARSAGTARGSGAVDDEGLTAADYRRRAAAALDTGAWDAALLDGYRALAASAVERALLVELPGRTAHEVAVALRPLFPSHDERLVEAADAFDAVRYGRVPTHEAGARSVLELDAELAGTRPHAVGVPA